MSFGPGYIAKAPSNILLDRYPGAAAAYSLRLLRTGHQGSGLVRVRRSSDNDEAVVLADTSFSTPRLSLDSPLLNSSADFQSFIGSDDGFVVVWKEQSPNQRDASQSTQADQPQIVSSGSVVTENGKPALVGDGSSAHLDAAEVSISQPNVIYIVSGVTANKSALFDGINQRQHLFKWVNTSDNPTVFAGNGVTASYTPTGQQITDILFDGTTSEYKGNGVVEASGDFGDNNLDGLRLFANSPLNYFGDIPIQEMIVRGEEDRAEIRTNMNNFYDTF